VKAKGSTGDSAMTMIIARNVLWCQPRPSVMAVGAEY
jgi:hypothetical protein